MRSAAPPFAMMPSVVEFGTILLVQLLLMNQSPSDGAVQLVCAAGAVRRESKRSNAGKMARARDAPFGQSGVP